ncbi:MAG: PsbP-related protein [bacterium]|nr:PsbP-related protein [bacterium]
MDTLNSLINKIRHQYLFIFLCFFIFITIIAFIVLFKNNTLQKSAEMTRTQRVSLSAGQELTSYTDNYYGFSLKYPKQWHTWQLGRNNFIYQSYDGTGKDGWYVPNKDEIQIELSVWRKGEDDMYIKGPKQFIIKEVVGPYIDGNPSVEIHTKSPLSGYEINRYENFGLSQSLVNKNHEQLRYVVTKNDFIYTISIEPEQSDLIKEFNTFLSNIRFVAPAHYLSRSSSSGSNSQYYEDTYVGYTFDYPSGASVSASQGSHQYGSIKNPSLTFRLISRPPDTSREFKRDIVTDVPCEADGPMGSVRCPPEYMKTEEFTNKNSVNGVKIYRKMITTFYGKPDRISEKDDFIIAYPLDNPEYYAIVFEGEGDAASLENVATTFNYLQPDTGAH